jgi:D-glycero-alpha-D-manno-heptose 1-phosphate guanylyltransferase
MEAVILAGGLGTRLGSRLGDLPKSMASVRGRPFLAFLLDRLASAGCARVILSVGHLREAIIDKFQSSHQGMRLQYAIEDTPLGTGGAIRFALSQASEESVLVLNGDTYVDLDFRSITAHHDSSLRPMTMAVTRVEDTARYGGVMIENGQVAGLIEKGRVGPGWINAGVYVLNRKFPWPDNLPSRFSFETDLLGASLDRIRPSAFLYEGYFLDIGIPEDLDRAQVELGDATSDRCI